MVEILRKKKFISLLSGGFDSYVTAEFIIQKYTPTYIHLLNIYYGQVNYAELFASKNLYKNLQNKYPNITITKQDFRIPDDFIKQLFNTSALVNRDLKQEGFEKDEQPTTYVPFRNLLFSTVACIIAENLDCSYVSTGIQPHSEYYYWDATNKFVDKLNKLISLNPKKVQIVAPFKNKSKRQIYEIAKNELNLTDDELSMTWSCYNPVIKKKDGILFLEPCNKCGSCKERNNAGIPQSNTIKIKEAKNES